MSKKRLKDLKKYISTGLVGIYLKKTDLSLYDNWYEYIYKYTCRYIRNDRIDTMLLSL